jgi:hypothetical protein
MGVYEQATGYQQEKGVFFQAFFRAYPQFLGISLCGSWGML